MKINNFLFLAASGVLTQALFAQSPKLSPVRVALIFDLSQSNSEAIEMIQGFEIGAEELRQNHVHLSIEKYNSGPTAQGTRSAVLSALATTPSFLVAEVNSSKAFIAAEIAEKEKRFMVSPLASSPSVSRGRQHVFTISYLDDFQGQKLADFAISDLKAKRAAIFVDAGQLYSKTLGDAFKTEFVIRGGTVPFEKRVLETNTDFSQELASVQGQSIDVLFLPVYEELAARIINQAINKGLDVKFVLGGDGWYPRDIFSDLLSPKKMPFKLFWVNQFHFDKNDKILQRRLDEIKRRLGKSVNGSIAAGYDTAILIGQVIRNMKGPVPHDRLSAIVHKLPPYKGLANTYFFGNKQNPSKSVYIYSLNAEGSHFFTELAQ